MNKLLTIMLTGSMALSGCGSDGDGGSGADGGAAQSELADLLLEQSEGVGFDEQCIQDKAAELSDDDAQFLIDNIDVSDVDGFSSELQAWVDGLIECLDDA